MKLSIITVCKNEEKKIERTIESVLSQTFIPIEYIVIDGKSTDDTVERIRNYELRITNKKFKNRIVLKWISEKDKGIYNAMNKGIKRSTGDVLYFLNAGDAFINAYVLETIMDAFHEPSSQIVVGNTLVVNPKKGKSYRKQHKNTGKSYLFFDTINHQAIFAKKNLFTQYGLFNEKYTIMSDYDWQLRMADNHIPIKYVDMVIARYVDEGISSQTDSGITKRHILERKEIIGKHFSIQERLWYSAFLPWDFLKRKVFPLV